MFKVSISDHLLRKAPQLIKHFDTNTKPSHQLLHYPIFPTDATQCLPPSTSLKLSSQCHRRFERNQNKNTTPPSHSFSLYRDGVKQFHPPAFPYESFRRKENRYSVRFGWPTPFAGGNDGDRSRARSVHNQFFVLVYTERARVYYTHHTQRARTVRSVSAVMKR